MLAFDGDVGLADGTDVVFSKLLIINATFDGDFIIPLPPLLPDEADATGDPTTGD